MKYHEKEERFAREVQEALIYREYRIIATDCPAHGSYADVIAWRKAAIYRYKTDALMAHKVNALLNEIMRIAKESELK